ncbi:unnamed protein product [Bubo scandiacus]
MAATGNDSFVGEGMTPPQRILFPPEKICMEWQQRQRAGAGLHNMGNTCFLNSVLQCLTYTPPLANYLLSREHSQSCRQQGFCMMCRMERHVNDVLQSSGRAIQPWAIVSVLTRIGEHFKLGMQEDAHEFLRLTVAAMQEACLSGSSNLDMASQSTTIVHQIFAGFLRSRVTCLSCNMVSDYYEAFLDVPLHIKAASSVTAALENFVKPEQLDGENGFKCSRCDKMVAASKRFTVHHAPKVFTVCLNRYEDFTSRKISKFVEYPEYLDLRPYMSQTTGEPLLYSLYAVLVHHGAICHAGHYYCYTKASNGLWYVMDDSSVDRCDIDTVLRQQAYLLFYVRCSESQLGQRAYSSPTPSYAPSFLSRVAANRKQVGSVGPQGLPRQTKVNSGDTERSRSPRWGHDLRSRFVETKAYDPSAGRRRSPPSCASAPRVNAAPGPSNSSSLLAPTHRAAREQAPPRQTERSRSPWRGHDLRSPFLEYTDHHRSLRRSRAARRWTQEVPGLWQLRGPIVGEGMTPPQRILFPPEKICMEWQQRQRAGAGLHNMGNTCFLNSVLQCLTYTPPLANYLLSREHSQSCRQQGFCMMCRMERHVNDVLQSSGRAIQPWAIVSVLTRIGEHFKLGMQEDAHEFLRLTVAAMQEACLSGSSNLDMASQSTTIVHQIFAGFLRSRVTCLSCNMVSDYYEAFLDVPLHIKAASSVTAALENFVKPEQLDGENGFKCSRCDKMVAASKRFTVHHAPKVFTVCLNRYEDFTSRKISKFVEYPEYLDLRPYMSQTTGEPLLYSLYAVLVHHGAICHAGHYYCYTKASNGLWYVMDDSSVDRCDIDTVLRQQAYLLFYVRCSESQLGQRAYSSPTPSYAPSFLSRAAANRKQVGSVGPQGLPRQTKVNSGDTERSRSPRRGHDLRSRFVETKAYDPSAGRRRSPPSCASAPRVNAAPGPSNSSSLLAPTHRAAREQAPPRQTERSRSPWRGHDLRSPFLEYTDHHRSLRRSRAARRWTQEVPGLWQLRGPIVGEGMTPPQRILFPPEKICMEWQQRQRAGAGLHNMGNTCFLNSVLQCLTYTPPLANYLLSREHSQSCRQQGFCMMCRMERHVNDVLQSSGRAIQPWAIVSVLTRIGEHFKLGMQEDAHEFLRLTVAAMQEACLSGSSNLDMASQSTTIVHQIFAGFLRSRVTCLSCNMVSDYYEAFLDVPLHIKAASSVTAALENFVKPEQLDGENGFKCSRCDKMVAASKRFTVHHAPKVFTVCLNRYEDFTSRKISKFVEYPEYLDLRPYMSQTTGEPLLYSLYAVLVHHGAICHAGHYYCYTKASNGLWYVMDDSSVDRCDIDTVLRQQAYLLFYVR